MPQVINTNVTSLNAQRNLNTSGSGLATALQRLSSGMRINSAKDDAAGLAISNRMTAQIRGLNQASRNANDGISLAQTAEGGLGTITGNLQRIRELAIQSANATNSASDRAALQTEAAQLISEIDRIATTTSFNNVNLLDGTFASQQFQVGANANQTISVSSISSARTSALGASFSSQIVGGTVTANAISAGDLIINGISLGEQAGGVGANNDAKDIAAAINALSGTGVTATAQSNSLTGGTVVSDFANNLADGDLTINGVSVGAVTSGADATGQTTNVINAINGISATTGVVASNATATTITLTAADGRNIVVGFAGAGDANSTSLAAGTTRSSITLDSTGSQGITLSGAAETDVGFTDN